MEDTSYRRLSAHFVDFDSQDGDDTFMLHAEAEEHVPVAVQRFRTTACLSVLVALLADYLLLTVVIPLMPELLPPENHTTFQMGLLFAAQPIVQIVVNPLFGMLVDRTQGGRAVMFMGCCVAAVATVGFMVGASFWELVGARAVQGIGSAATMTGGMAFLNTIHPPDKRGAASGTAMGGVALGVVFGPAVGGGLYHWAGRLAPFYLVLGLLALAALVQLFLACRAMAIASSLLHQRNDEDGSCSSALKVFTDPLMLVLCLAVMATNAAEAMIEPVLPRFLKVAYGMGPGTSGLVFSAVPFAYLIATPVAGALGDKGAKWKLVWVGTLFMTIGLPIMWVATLVADEKFVSLDETPGLILIIASLALAGAGLALVDAPSMPLATEVMDWRGSGAYGSAVAAVNMSVNLGFILGPLGGSAIAQHYGTSIGMASFAILTLLVSPLVWVLRRMSARRRPVLGSKRHSAISLTLSPSPDTRAV